LITLAILAISGLALAQGPAADPPGRVAHLGLLEGQVSIQPGGVDDWVAASQNRPLTTADRVWTDLDSRAELSIASAALRLASETSLTITNLDDNTLQVELDQGTLSLSVRHLNEEEIVEVDTPNLAFTVNTPGEYRFDVRPDQDQTWVTVRRGDGLASGEAGDVEVQGGQRFIFSQGQSLSYTVSGIPDRDGFDDWSALHEQLETSSPSARYVAPGTIGIEALDGNGNWEPSPVYGAVWYPNVYPGWAPYREGHWAWVEPWGWTWVDDAPWGFAPFHYGRWVNAGGRWGWVPGPVQSRPVYAPALVAWVGGPGFGASFGIAGGGGVGWVALGWHDPFIPTYSVSAEYARDVNLSSSRVVNVTVINNYYATTNVNVRNTAITNIQYENVKVSGALMVVPNDGFASGRPVGKMAVTVPASAVGRVSFIANANVFPTKAAVLGGHTPATAPARLVVPRQVASKVAPPARPVSFEQQRPLLEKSNGVPLSPEARNTLRKSAPASAPAGGKPAGKPPVAMQPGGNPSGRPPAMNMPGRPAPAPAANKEALPAPAPAGGKPAGKPPVAMQPGGNPSGRPPAMNMPGRPAAAPAPAGNKEAPPAPAPGGGQPAGKPPVTMQPGGNPSGRPPAMNMPGRPAPAPAVNKEAPPAPAPAGGQPAGKPPVVMQPGGNPSGRPPAMNMPGRPAPAPAANKDAAPTAAHPAAAPAPAANKEAAPAQQKKTPPPAKDNKEKEKENDPKGH
jgi:hypothetical protein